MTSRRTLAAVAAAAVLPFTGASAALAAPSVPAVLHVGEIARQDVTPLPASEPDTLVEPDIAVWPGHPDVAVAAAHDGRYPDGGAVAIAYAWTHDAGATWHHGHLPGLTKSTGSARWDRASDPVVAIADDGTVYVSTLLFTLGCDTGVAVSRSTDGGRTFGPPVLAHQSRSCRYSDDKNWLVVDNSTASPHRGRLYQFWTPFLYDAKGNNFGAQQVVRWSDDKGAHWSSTVALTPRHLFTQNSQPMLRPDGTIVDAYLNFGSAAGDEGPEALESHRHETERSPSSEARQPVGDRLVARTSTDGGRTWSAETLITADAGEGPRGIRCCLASATADPRTGALYAVWNAVEPTSVRLSRSLDGKSWSHPVQVNPPRAGTDTVNADVSAYGGRVFVSYGVRDLRRAGGNLVQQEIRASYDNGRTFPAGVAVGPYSDLRFAAEAGGKFPGDYVGSAAWGNRVYAAWALSSHPTHAGAKYRQRLWAAVLRP